MGARAADPGYVTVHDRLLCRTQSALIEGLRVLATRRKRDVLGDVDGCYVSIDGIPAIVLQDNISQIKIRLSARGEHADVWTVPEAIRRVRSEREPDPDE
jgi:hypothetical protein